MDETVPLRALCAIDLEDGEVGATTARAGALLARLRARADLLYVDPFVACVPPDRTPELDVLLQAARDRHDAELAGRLVALWTAWPPGARGEARVLRDVRPADGIVAAAAEYALVVVGTRARRGAARLWLGSVAEKVVRTSTVPVLVARSAPPGADPRRALLAVDVFDEASSDRVREAALWAGRLGVRLDLAHAVGSVAPDPIAHGAAWVAALAELVGEIKAHLEALAEALAPEVRGRTRVLHGEAACVVADAAADYALAIVGTHGRRGLRRAWFGSVAEPVVRRAAVPVLVLPGPRRPPSEEDPLPG